VRTEPAALRGAPMFLTNTLIGVRAVGRLDDEALTPCPRIQAIAEVVGIDGAGRK
jgi:hypothetical protein